MEHDYNVAMMVSPQPPLGEFEHIVLLAVMHLDDGAGTGRLREFLEDRTGRTIARGALYTTLDRLEAKGLVRSRMGDAAPERGGLPRRLYRPTAAGVRALKQSRASLLSLWRGLESRLT